MSDSESTIEGMLAGLSPSHRNAALMGMRAGALIRMHDEDKETLESMRGIPIDEVANPLQRDAVAPVYFTGVYYGTSDEAEFAGFGKPVRPGVSIFAHDISRAITEDQFPARASSLFKNEYVTTHRPVEAHTALFRIPEGMLWSEVTERILSAGYVLPDANTALAFFRMHGQLSNAEYNHGVVLTDESILKGPRRSPEVLLWESRRDSEADLSHTLSLQSVFRRRGEYDAVLAVVNPEECNYIKPNAPPSPEFTTEQALQRLAIGAQLIALAGGPKKEAYWQVVTDLTDDLTAHHDASVATMAIDLQLSRPDSWMQKYYKFEQIGLAMGSVDEAVALRAAHEIVDGLNPESEEGNPALAALDFHGNLVHGHVADVFFATALELISSPTPLAWFGQHDTRKVDLGYEVMSRLLFSSDYKTAATAYNFLHARISGGEALTADEQRYVLWLTTQEALSEGEAEKKIWQGFRDTVTNGRLTSNAEDSYRAMRYIATLCPHDDIRTSALADIEDYENVVLETEKKGFYVYYE